MSSLDDSFLIILGATFANQLFGELSGGIARASYRDLNPRLLVRIPSGCFPLLSLWRDNGFRSGCGFGSASGFPAIDFGAEFAEERLSSLGGAKPSARTFPTLHWFVFPGFG